MSTRQFARQARSSIRTLRSVIRGFVGTQRGPGSTPATNGDAMIWEFLEQSHVVAISANDDEHGRPWTFNAFYVFNREKMGIYFLSQSGTRHVELFQRSPAVSGVVTNQPEDFAEIKGVQFTGSVRLLEGDEREVAANQYYTRFPLAAFAGSAPFWVVDLDMVKFTNNELGFGTKMYWPEDARP